MIYLENGDKEIVIFGVANEFIQAIVSIFTNIFELLEERKLQHVNIDVVLKKNKNDVFIEISDTAGGIEKENLFKIFDPYFTTKHQAIGTGLGLYIAKMIIEETMQGSMRATNQKNGALFSIRIPLAH